MTDLLENINQRHAAQFTAAYNAGSRKFDMMGGRRSGKSYFIEQFLLTRVLSGMSVNVATMTAEQGRLGAYEDCKTILASMPAGLQQYYEVMKNPREIVCKSTPNGRSGRGHFKSFQDAETAKGIACDWVFINEANKFSLQQYYDLAANARKGVILDYNPQGRFWVDDLNVTPLQCSKEILVLRNLS